MKQSIIGKSLIRIISLAAIIGLSCFDRVAQDAGYHQFVDARNMFGIPNFWNVISNAPFFFVGIIGMFKLRKMTLSSELMFVYGLLFFAITLVAFGSSYYHLNPNNVTLVWDRLPMTVAFMSLFAIIISEFIDEQRGSILLIPLILLGIASVVYWHWTESNGVGDLRYYALVQFLPMILIPIILITYQSKFTKTTAYWWLLLTYIIAKVLEYYDEDVYQLTGMNMSGHAIKHVVAALGIYLLLMSYLNRKRIIN